jgi:hypothetical protein
MRLTMKQTALALALAGVFTTANATLLTPNVISNSVDVVASDFGGTLLDSATTLINNPSYNGFARTAVYDTGTGLDFYYQFSNDSTSINGVARFSMFDFSSENDDIVQVFQTANGFDMFVNGTEMSDGADRTTPGVIGFSFEPNGASKITPGTSSYIQIIRTNARDYVAGNFGLLNGWGDNAVAFAPAIPEPETYAMMLAGLGLIGFIGRRRLTQAASGFNFLQGGAGMKFA